MKSSSKWVQVFKSGPKKICGRQPLRRPYPFKFFKVCLPQILLGPLLNTLSQKVTDAPTSIIVLWTFDLSLLKYLNSFLLSNLVRKRGSWQWPSITRTNDRAFQTFDYLPHKLMIAKLNASGYNLKALKLMHNYVSRNNKTTRINESYITLQHILIGELEGSVVRPILLFSVAFFLLWMRLTLLLCRWN